MTESTESIIAEYCLMSRRRFGWYDPANQTVTGIPTIRLKYCTLVSEVDIAKKSPKFDFLKEVKKLLRKRIDSELEINHWEIEETLAHSQKHVSAIRNEAISRAKALEREMCLEFGMPVKLSAKSRKEIRFGGVEYSVAWQIGAKRVFLVVNNDDVGLPFQLILLVRVKGEKREK